MTTVWPLRFRHTPDDLLFTDAAGGWFVANDTFLERYASGRLTPTDDAFLVRGGHAYQVQGDLPYSSFLRRWAGRHAAPIRNVAYLILVPTLRCNLACDYCQVSRAPEGAPGFDWTEETLGEVLAFIDKIEGDRIKIEFQGGEPLLRLDLLDEVRAHCRERFTHASFVVCSNFQRVSPEAWSFFDSEDTFLSTSVDGDIDTQTRQRTHDADGAAAFFTNVREFIERFGPDRVSALPTVDLAAPVEPDKLIDAYANLGLRSIYLRPVNRQGFARRKAALADEAEAWRQYHRRFVAGLIARNADGDALEEFYLTNAIRRVLRPGVDGHVDLRNPSLVADSYLVVDYDGSLYPSDEARMMSRVGQVDLSVGTIAAGVDRTKVDTINAWSFNDLDPDCQHCAFQPYCGTDVIDDISRYGRIDIPRGDTWFCQRHTALFDLVFELLRSPDPKVQHSMRMWAGVEQWPAFLRDVHQ